MVAVPQYSPDVTLLEQQQDQLQKPMKPLAVHICLGSCCQACRSSSLNSLTNENAWAGSCLCNSTDAEIVKSTWFGKAKLLADAVQCSNDGARDVAGCCADLSPAAVLGVLAPCQLLQL